MPRSPGPTFYGNFTILLPCLYDTVQCPPLYSSSSDMDRGRPCVMEQGSPERAGCHCCGPCIHLLENPMPISRIGEIAYQPASPSGGIRLQANPPVCNHCWQEITRQNFG